MIYLREIKNILCKLTCAVTVLTVLVSFGAANSDAGLKWKGVDWLEYLGAQLYVNQYGYLEVRPRPGVTATSIYAAQHITSNDFRSASAPWVEVIFQDDPAKLNTVELWMTDRENAWTQIGAQNGNYTISWLNLSDGEMGTFDTGISRSYGQQKVKLGMQKDGKLDYWFNDTLIWSASTEKMQMKYFGDIYLAAQLADKNSLATFNDFQTGTDYNPPVSGITIELDIRPGGNPNNINLSSRGVVPVAVLTTESFDAKNVNPKSLFFAKAQPTRCNIADVENDGDLDLLCHFETQDLHLDLDATAATLTGTTYDGQEIKGTDSIRIVLRTLPGKKKSK